MSRGSLILYFDINSSVCFHSMLVTEIHFPLHRKILAYSTYMCPRYGANNRAPEIRRLGIQARRCAQGVCPYTKSHFKQFTVHTDVHV